MTLGKKLNIYIRALYTYIFCDNLICLNVERYNYETFIKTIVQFNENLKCMIMKENSIKLKFLQYFIYFLYKLEALNKLLICRETDLIIITRYNKYHEIEMFINFEIPTFI